MADSNYSNSTDDKGLAQDDPFAELTRIMGHDPRPVRRPEPVKEENADDLALELENELMGNLTGDEEATAASASDEWAQEDPATHDTGHRPSSAEPEPAQPQQTFTPDQLSAIFEEAFSSHGDPEASRKAASRAPDFDAPQDAGTSDEDAGQPMRFVSFRNAAPLLPALAEAARKREEAQDEGSVDDRFSPRWDETDSQPQEDEAYASLAGAQEDWSDEETGQGGDMELSQPEVETVDVPGEGIAPTDNLDLPDVRYGEEPAKSELDEIEELLAGAFSAPGRTAEPPRQTRVGESGASESEAASMDGTDWNFDDEPSEFADEEASLSRNDEATVFNSLNDLHSQLSNRTASDGAGPEMVPSPGQQQPQRQGRSSGRRVLLGSAAVLCLLLAGGAVTYFGLGGDADSSAVVVQADDEPVKIKPDDPGGTTIPNQDNQVYKRVSGEDAEPEPSETRLVSTTEEPVDLPGVRDVQGSEPEIAASDADQPEQSGLSQPADTSAKIDDRLQNTIAEEPAQGEVTALEPRRVRSLVVRPDGSMVPREMPEPETANAAPTDEASAAVSQSGTQGGTAEDSLSQQAAAAPVETGGQPAAQSGQTDAAAGQTDAAAVQQQPESVPIPASRPDNPEPAPQAQEPAEAPQPQTSENQVAAASPQPAQPAVAAPSSEWSVQIASQPSVEGAQQSYQQLAQRYGNLLEGRGVNIVKADISGKGTYYRVRIPSSSKDEAIRLCEQLKSAGGNCFVSK